MAQRAWRKAHGAKGIAQRAWRKGHGAKGMAQKESEKTVRDGKIQIRGS
jgi:hypothetical protein